jgi:hypothetical protein
MLSRHLRRGLMKTTKILKFEPEAARILSMSRPTNHSAATLDSEDCHDIF